MSDEYGPYVYKFTSDGKLLEAIQPPNAILPFIDGIVNFTAQVDPDTGRAANQGLPFTIKPITCGIIDIARRVRGPDFVS